jgi:hypothetical protein
MRITESSRPCQRACLCVYVCARACVRVCMYVCIMCVYPSPLIRLNQPTNFLEIFYRPRLMLPGPYKVSFITALNPTLKHFLSLKIFIFVRMYPRVHIRIISINVSNGFRYKLTHILEHSASYISLNTQHFGS